MLLPENAVVRRINELVKRARSVKVHAYIIHYLRKQMPYMMGKQEKQVDRGFVSCALRFRTGWWDGLRFRGNATWCLSPVPLLIEFVQCPSRRCRSGWLLHRPLPIGLYVVACLSELLSVLTVLS